MDCAHGSRHGCRGVLAHGPVLTQHAGRDLQKLLFGLVTVRDHRGFQEFGASGDVRQPVGQQSTGAGFSNGESFMFGHQ